MTVCDEAKQAMEGVTPGRLEVLHDDEIWSEDRKRYIGQMKFPRDAEFVAWCFKGVPALLAEIAAKDAEIARLREAMAPFDRMSGAMFARNWNKDGVAISFVEKDGPIRLTFTDFLAVRAALKGDTP